MNRLYFSGLPGAHVHDAVHRTDAASSMSEIRQRCERCNPVLRGYNRGRYEVLR